MEKITFEDLERKLADLVDIRMTIGEDLVRVFINGKHEGNMSKEEYLQHVEEDGQRKIQFKD